MIRDQKRDLRKLNYSLKHSIIHTKTMKKKGEPIFFQKICPTPAKIEKIDPKSLQFCKPMLLPKIYLSPKVSAGASILKICVVSFHPHTQKITRVPAVCSLESLLPPFTLQYHLNARSRHVQLDVQFSEQFGPQYVNKIHSKNSTDILLFFLATNAPPWRDIR